MDAGNVILMAEQIKHALALVKEARISKKSSGYFEIDNFKDTKDLNHGYFCYSCVYFINMQGGRCAIVHNGGDNQKEIRIASRKIN